MKRNVPRMIIATLIGLMPINLLRVYFYRIIFGYKIHNAYIGWNTYIYVDEAELTDCLLGRNNRFSGPMKIKIMRGAQVGSNNTFDCGWWTQEDKFLGVDYGRRLELRENITITSRHHFDVAGIFVLDRASWIAGIGSQFWTHGVGVKDRNIYIGEHCYLGSGVKFSPGSSVSNNTIVALGSIVTKKHECKYILIGGVPAKILKENYDWKSADNYSRGC